MYDYFLVLCTVFDSDTFYFNDCISILKLWGILLYSSIEDLLLLLANSGLQVLRLF